MDISGLVGSGSAYSGGVLTIDPSSTVPLASTSTWSYGQLVGLLERHGFNQAQAQVGAAVAMAESGGNPNAVNQSSGAAGLFQILGPHTGVNGGQVLTLAQATNPDQAAAAAYTISNGGTNWSPWSAFTGGQYKRYLNTSAGGTPVTSTTLASSPTVAAAASNVGSTWGTFGKWALGFGVVAVVIVAGTDSPKVRPLAYGFAALMAAYVVFANNGATGQAAWAELKHLVGAS